MKRILVSLAFVGLIASNVEAKSRNISINFDDEGDLTSCDQLKVSFGDDREEGFRAEEQVAVAGLKSLKIHAATNGGIYVTGARGSQYSVTACKAAEMQETLSDLRVNLSGNEVTASGGSGNWVVYFLVTVPRGADLDLRANNGPIALRSVNGRVVAHATNGPISAKQSSGNLDLDTQNGPISLSGGSGNVKLNAQNGPISVRFDGNTWDGSLDANTQNGPLSIRVPRDFRSGLVVQSRGRGPISCRGEACRDARRTFDDDDERKIEMGSGPTVVRMSTVNGPISVKDSE
jgi:hypothetical protein